MATLTLKIDGMSCQHCVMAVKKAVDEVIGVNSSDVTVGSASVDYDDSRTSKDEIASAVVKAGYKVVS